MVQILPNARPSFSERLNAGVGRGLEIGQELIGQQQQRKQQQQMQQQQEMQFKQENETVKNLIGKDISGIRDPKIRQSFVDMALKGENEAASRAGKLGEGNEANIARKEKAQGSFNTLVETLKRKNIGQGSNYKALFGGDTAKDVGRFKAALAPLESMLTEIVNPKGTLTDAKFKYITKTILPAYDDTEQEIEGKLIELARILDLDPSELGVKAESSGKGAANGKRPPLSSFHG